LYLAPERIENDLWVSRGYFPQLVNSREAFPDGSQWKSRWPSLRQQLGGMILVTHAHPLDIARQHSISFWEWQMLTDLRALRLPVLWYPGYRAIDTFSASLLEELHSHRFGVLKTDAASPPFEPTINLFGMVRPVAQTTDNVVTFDDRRRS
jgi:hypothetical protein